MSKWQNGIPPHSDALGSVSKGIHQKERVLGAKCETRSVYGFKGREAGVFD